MDQYYLHQEALVLGNSISFKQNGTGDLERCDLFWDSVNARITPCYLPLISALPAAVAVLVLIGHVLRMLIPYQPEWTKPFIKEYKETYEGLVEDRRHRLTPSVAALVLLSFTGLVLQLILLCYPVFRVQGVYPAVAWATAGVMVLLNQPRTTPTSVLILYISIVTARTILMIDAPLPSRREEIISIFQFLLSLSSIAVILCMPLRDPELPADAISKAFDPPTFEFRSPEDNMTLWQFLSVAWMSPLISRGKQQQLHEEDVWKLPHEFQHQLLHDRFRELKGTVVTRLIKANGIDIMIVTVLSTLDLLATLSSPILLQQLLSDMEDSLAPTSDAINYAVLAMVARLISGQIGVLNQWYGRRAYERSRGEMITMLYEKTLSRKIIGANMKPAVEGKAGDAANGDGGQHKDIKQSIWSRTYTFLARPLRWKKSLHLRDTPVDKTKEPASMGKILNLMRSDVYEVAQRFWEIQNLINRPLGMILSIVLIWQLIGWPCLIGVLTVFVAQTINVFITRSLLRWEKIRRTATDKKLQKISQFVEAIRHLRWYGWQNAWQAEIMDARQHELNLRIVTRMLNMLIQFTNTFASGMFPVAAFYAYSGLAGLPLRIDIAFPALRLFSILAINLREIPNLITTLLNARIAVGRIEDFMAEPNLDEQHQGVKGDVNGRHTDEEDAGSRKADKANGTVKSSKSNGHPKPGVSEVDTQQVSAPDANRLELKKATFAWPGTSELVLKDLTLSFPVGMTVVCGEVAAGKSALLQALLGELDRKGGELFRNDETVGFCAQSPWLQSMSIRDNILFSTPYEDERYKDVLKACALISDMANFKHGDLSNIGEKGIGLSGGQKARVALARAVYSTANVVLLDDPISALDHQTADFVVRNCLAGPLMKGRVLVLVTHRTELCQGLAEQFVEISHGHAKVLDPDENLSHGLSRLKSTDSNGGTADEEIEDKTLAAVPEKFIEDEYMARGGVQAKVYWEYIKAGKLRWWFILVLSQALFRVITVGETWFLKSWGEAYGSSEPIRSTSSGPFDDLPSPDDNIKPWLVGFAIIAIVKSIMFLIAQSIMLVIVYTAGKQMFGDVMERVSHATFRFYDITPVGRLMNRLTSDISTIDGNISARFQSAAMLTIAWISAVVVIGSVTPVFLIFATGLIITFVVIFLHFLPCSQSLRRLEMVSLSPLMSNFGALLDGLMTVRAFCAQSRFQDRVVVVVDLFQGMDHFYWSLQTWLQYRFDIVAATSTLLLTLIAIWTGVSPGLTAFVLIAAQNLVDATHWLCRTYGALQMDFVSVERVVELLHLDQEKPGTINPPAWWPTLAGDIIFEDVTIRYAPKLDPSLQELSFTIKAGSNTAIIGRTGSGKSTLAMALLATVLPETGRILIDNVDISAVDTQTLRRRVTFVAQDPVLFPGSMRQNLDPMNDYSDEECEAVLIKICGRHQWTLETQIDTGGRNLSQGQRQLIGLARTLLRRSPIVILDEATASIDMETAMSIQQVLHEEMRESTVITIAHRLEAVKNAEYCIVLGKGRVVKHGRAEDILRENSGLLHDSGKSAD